MIRGAKTSTIPKAIAICTTTIGVTKIIKTPNAVYLSIERTLVDLLTSPSEISYTIIPILGEGFSFLSTRCPIYSQSFSILNIEKTTLIISISFSQPL